MSKPDVAQVSAAIFTIHRLRQALDRLVPRKRDAILINGSLPIKPQRQHLQSGTNRLLPSRPNRSTLAGRSFLRNSVAADFLEGESARQVLRAEAELITHQTHISLRLANLLDSVAGWYILSDESENRENVVANAAVGIIAGVFFAPI